MNKSGLFVNIITENDEIEVKKLGAKKSKDSSMWYIPKNRKINDFTKWIKLTIELVPNCLQRMSVRSLLTQGSWDRIRQVVYKRANNSCEICGSIGLRYPVACHEIWDYDNNSYIQCLKDFIALCPSCHGVKHFGLSRIMGYEEQATQHLCNINNWTIKNAKKYIDESFEIYQLQNLHSWEQNLDFLKKFSGENNIMIYSKGEYESLSEDRNEKKFYIRKEIKELYNELSKDGDTVKLGFFLVILSRKINKKSLREELLKMKIEGLASFNNFEKSSNLEIFDSVSQE